MPSIAFGVDGARSLFRPSHTKSMTLLIDYDRLRSVPISNWRAACHLFDPTSMVAVCW